jgi:hypothetical protein
MDHAFGHLGIVQRREPTSTMMTDHAGESRGLILASVSKGIGASCELQ